MAKCRNCNIEILDVSPYCPLCRTVLEADDSLENMYPNERAPMRKYHLLSRIYLFVIILIELVLVLLNFVLKSEIWWCIITALGLLYSYLVLRYAIIGKSGHRSKAFVLILFGLLSTMVVESKMSFFSDALGHSAFTGIAIGAICGIAAPLWAAVGFSVVFALVFSYVRSRSNQAADTLIGNGHTEGVELLVGHLLIKHCLN